MRIWPNFLYLGSLNFGFKKLKNPLLLTVTYTFSNSSIINGFKTVSVDFFLRSAYEQNVVGTSVFQIKLLSLNPYFIVERDQARTCQLDGRLIETCDKNRMCYVYFRWLD
jgi:hypothetical protein